MNRERWLLLASFLMFVGVGVYYFRPGGGVRSAGSSPAGVSQPPTFSPFTQEIRGESLPQASIKSEVVEEQTPWGRNPFLTEKEEVEGRGWKRDDGFQVKAIIVGQPRAVATLDGHTVVVGEKVGEETVWEIRPDAVVLEKDGRKRVLRIKEPSIAIEAREGTK
ncbi:MAG: cbb3-type cytochrome c oxidase subunit 3 [Deltaproteobacteria bacterium]|nr:cbb3-type cytochrome c oxidase subunit 3 [Deltaproteobacteria bacterium]